MSAPIISLLIRTSGRPQQFANCIRSIVSQTYPAANVKLVVGIEDDDSRDYVFGLLPHATHAVSLIKCAPDKSHPYYWNLHCNTLKEHVSAGWLMFLDDDDRLYKNSALSNIARYCDERHPETGLVFQFARGSYVKPSYPMMIGRRIVKGMIGGGCMVLHHSQKNVADWDGQEAADYRWLKQLEASIPLKFIPIVTQQAGPRQHGKKEQPLFSDEVISPT